MRHLKSLIVGTTVFIFVGTLLASENQQTKNPPTNPLSSPPIESKQKMTAPPIIQPMLQPMREFSGNVLEIKDSQVVLDRMGFDPTNPQKKEKITFTISSGTKITRLKQKSPARFQKEMTEYNETFKKFMDFAKKNAPPPGETNTSKWMPPTSVNPVEEIPAALKDIAPGAQLKITVKEAPSDQKSFVPQTIVIMSPPPPVITPTPLTAARTIQKDFNGKITAIQNSSFEFEPFEFNPFRASGTLKVSTSAQTKIIQLLPRDPLILQKEMDDFQKKIKETQHKTQLKTPLKSPDYFQRKIISLRDLKKGDTIHLIVEQDSQKKVLLKAVEIQANAGQQNQAAPVLSMDISFSAQITSLRGTSLILKATDTSPGVDPLKEVQLLTTSETQIIQSSPKDPKVYQKEISLYQKNLKNNQHPQTFQPHPSPFQEEKRSLKDIKNGDLISVSASRSTQTGKENILTARRITLANNTALAFPLKQNQYFSGKISDKQDSKLILEISLMPPEGKPAKLITITINAQTKILQSIPKDLTVFQKEMEDYQKRASNSARGPAKIPPRPFDEKISSSSSIKKGDSVNVTVLTAIQNQSGKAEIYTAQEIRIAPRMTPPKLPEMTIPPQVFAGPPPKMDAPPLSVGKTREEKNNKEIKP